MEQEQREIHLVAELTIHLLTENKEMENKGMRNSEDSQPVLQQEHLQNAMTTLNLCHANQLCLYAVPRHIGYKRKKHFIKYISREVILSTFFSE